MIKAVMNIVVQEVCFNTVRSDRSVVIPKTIGIVASCLLSTFDDVSSKISPSSTISLFANDIALY